MRYYSIHRPVMPGGFPKSGEGAVDRIKNFDDRTFCEEIGREAWGYIEYKEPITEEEARAYELVPAGMKIWYEVTVAWYNNGKIFAFVSGETEATEKPAAKSKRYKGKEIYTNWYGSHEEAEEAVKKAQI